MSSAHEPAAEAATGPKPSSHRCPYKPGAPAWYVHATRSALPASRFPVRQLPDRVIKFDLPFDVER